MKVNIYNNYLKDIWSWEVVDKFPTREGKERYTIRVSYVNVADPEAKRLHAEIFGK